MDEKSVSNTPPTPTYIFQDNNIKSDCNNDKIQNSNSLNELIKTNQDSKLNIYNEQEGLDNFERLYKIKKNIKKSIQNTINEESSDNENNYSKSSKVYDVISSSEDSCNNKDSMNDIKNTLPAKEVKDSDKLDSSIQNERTNSKINYLRIYVKLGGKA